LQQPVKVMHVTASAKRKCAPTSPFGRMRASAVIVGLLFRRRMIVPVGVALTIALSVYAISLAWPVYSWDLRLPSPGGRYNLVVLRGDTAAFADFSYRMYVFPRTSTPSDQKKDSRVWFTPIWWGTAHLVYSGFNYPTFRWTGTNALEIDLNDLHPEPFQFEPVKRFRGSADTVVTSVVFGNEVPGNVFP
jgi:hypothetical protein